MLQKWSGGTESRKVILMVVEVDQFLSIGKRIECFAGLAQDMDYGCNWSIVSY